MSFQVTLETYFQFTLRAGKFASLVNGIYVSFQVAKLIGCVATLVTGMHILCLHVVSLCSVLQKVWPLACFKCASSLLLRIFIKRLNFALEFLRQFLVSHPVVVSQVAFVLALKAASLLFTFETEAFVLCLDVQVHISNL